MLAAAILAESDTIRIDAIVEAFGIDDVTLLRARRRLRQGGAGAVVIGAKRGPKGPSKLVPATVKRMRQLFEQGTSKKEIGRRLGVSDFSVRQAVEDMEVPGRVVDDQPKLNFYGTETEPEPKASESEENTAVETEAQHVASVPEGVNDTTQNETQEEANGGGSEPIVPEQHERIPTRAATQEEARLWAMLKLTRDGETETVFENTQALQGAGALVILPALQETGLLEAARETFTRLRDGVYGLRSVVLLLAFLALLRRPRPEKLKGINPSGLGDVLGLQRAPEVKTVRRKLSEIAKSAKSHELVKKLARRWLQENEDTIGSLYIDGHVRVYTGKQKLPKAHVTQRNLCEPATTDYWVNDKDGKPVFVITAKANAAMTKLLPLLLDEIEAELGDRRGTLVFDRGGWSIELFKAMIARGWHILTYRKGKKRNHYRKGFSKHSVTVDGKTVEYNLSEKNVRVGKGLKLREIAVLRPDGRQTMILTTHKKEEQLAAFLVYRMFSRWRQENYFKYMKENFALDALVDYDFELDDPDRDIPNPARKKLDKEIREAKVELAKLEQAYGTEAIDNVEAKRRTMRGFKIANGELGQRVKVARARIETLKQKRAAIPKRVPIGSTRAADEIVRLSTERKIFTDAIKAATYRAESRLIALLRPHFKRSDDEARDFLKTVFQHPADLLVDGDQVTVRFGPLSAPRFTAALRGLCLELNKLNPRFPESTYRIVYEVPEEPAEEGNPSWA